MIREDPSRRPSTPLGVLAGASMILLVLSGCGAGSGGTPPGSATADPTTQAPTTAPEPSASAGPAADSQLTIVVTIGDDAERVTYELECTAGAPVGESKLPDPAAACQALSSHGDLIVAKPDPGTMCTQQYGGPETAVVKGTVGGEQVTASFSRENGCEIARWAMFEPLLGTPGGTGTL
ncbi:SSI family serine proteinase inhibitor [Arthrobacter sp. HLT1-21]